MYKITYGKADNRAPKPSRSGRFKLAFRRMMWGLLPPEKILKGSGKIKDNGKEKLASAMLKGIIKPDDNVLVVGPSLDYRVDPSALFVCHHVSGRPGSTTLIDFRAPSIGIEKGDPADFGDLVGYRESMDESIVLFKEPFLSLTDVFSLSFKDNSFDVILDHSASFWICVRRGERGEKHGMGAVREVIDGYHRVLKEGGKVILMVNELIVNGTSDPLYNSIFWRFWNLLKEAGFKTGYEKVEDKYEFLVEYDPSEIPPLNWTVPIYFEPMIYKSSNVLIATKV